MKVTASPRKLSPPSPPFIYLLKVSKTKKTESKTSKTQNQKQQFKKVSLTEPWPRLLCLDFDRQETKLEYTARNNRRSTIIDHS